METSLERKRLGLMEQEAPACPGGAAIRPFLIPVYSPKIPPVKVVSGRRGASTKDRPTPLVHQVAEGQEGNFFQCHL